MARRTKPVGDDVEGGAGDLDEFVQLSPWWR